ncbi:hypothetical protein DFH09DRAFT_1327053 [Mycena vulgaris]|nr:hypothetical protein DFH09DRAFT_1327053 [Mycena vulgaris]
MIQLYTGLPIFADLSEGSALFQIATGQRPAGPKELTSDALWKYMIKFWAEDVQALPSIASVVEFMRALQRTGGRRGEIGCRHWVKLFVHLYELQVLEPELPMVSTTSRPADELVDRLNIASLPRPMRLFQVHDASTTSGFVSKPLVGRAN